MTEAMRANTKTVQLINYTFDKYSGGKWKKSLAYKPGGGGDE